MTVKAKVAIAAAGDVERLAKALKTNFLCNFMGKCEPEFMVRATVMACALNLKNHGVACSFRNPSVFVDGGCGLVENSESYRRLVQLELLIEEKVPAKECWVKDCIEDGKAVKIWMTQKLVSILDDYLDHHVEYRLF